MSDLKSKVAMVECTCCDKPAIGLEPRSLYWYCADHQNMPPVEISRLVAQKAQRLLNAQAAASGRALPGGHYCKEHQGNHRHYAPENCDLCRAKSEAARLKLVPMKYRRMAFNAQLQDENKALRAEVERLKASGLSFPAVETGRFSGTIPNSSAPPRSSASGFSAYLKPALISKAHATWEANTVLAVDDPSYDTFCGGWKAALSLLAATQGGE